MWREKKGVILRRVVSDVLIIGTGGIVLLLFRVLGDPYKRGFFCTDESLMHPYHDSTVTSPVLYGCGFVIGIVLIAITEGIWIFTDRATLPHQKRDISNFGKPAIFIRDAYLALVPFVFGAVTEHIITDIGKYSIGRLRPHFFDVCNPDLSKVNCSKGYIVDFECRGEDANKIREMRLSFPSGHSSFSTYVAVYLIIYLQRRLTFLFQSLIRPVLQLTLFVLAWYTCLSRISDYKHHPADVIGGAVIGITTAAIVAVCVSDVFTLPQPQQTEWKHYGSLNNQSASETDQNETTFSGVPTHF